MSISKILSVIPLFLFLLGSYGCQSGYTPKPRAYFRIEFPQKSYKNIQGQFPYSFQIPEYAQLSHYKGRFEDDEQAQNWLNIDFPVLKAHINLTYKLVNGNLGQLVEDAHTLVYKHTIKADAITQNRFEYEDANVYGILYQIKGNVASSIQFFCTDSVENFLRGALYIDAVPNKDSLAPVIDFIGQDIEVILRTLKWQNTSN